MRSKRGYDFEAGGAYIQIRRIMIKQIQGEALSREDRRLRREKRVGA